MATKLQWNSQYSTHNADIDREHQQLFSIVNNLLAIESPGGRMQQFKADIKSLFRYMQTHFRHEEELMQRIGYPDLAAHAALHEEIVVTMNGYLQNCVSFVELREKLGTFLMQWLLNHVIEVDCQLASYVDHHAMAGAV